MGAYLFLRLENIYRCHKKRKSFSGPLVNSSLVDGGACDASTRVLLRKGKMALLLLVSGKNSL